MLNNDLTRTDFHFKIIKFYLFVLLFEISSMIFIPKYVYIRWKKKKEKNHKKWIIRLCDRDPLSSSSRRIDAAASLDLRGHYSWISRVFHAYTCRSRIQRRSRCIVLWLSSRRKRACGIEEVRSIDRKRLARRFFYVHIKENGNAKSDLRYILQLWILISLDIINFRVSLDIKNPEFRN